MVTVRHEELLHLQGTLCGGWSLLKRKFFKMYKYGKLLWKGTTTSVCSESDGGREHVSLWLVWDASHPVDRKWYGMFLHYKLTA